MANEIRYRGIYTGLTYGYYMAVCSGQQYWNTSGSPAFETEVVANWANYKIALSEIVSGGYKYQGSMPAVPSNAFYAIEIYLQSGATAAITDTLVEVKYGWWNGTIFEVGAADVKAVAATVQTARDLGSSVNVLQINGVTQGAYDAATLANSNNAMLINGTSVGSLTSSALASIKTGISGVSVSADKIAGTVQTPGNDLSALIAAINGAVNNLVSWTGTNGASLLSIPNMAKETGGNAATAATQATNAAATAASILTATGSGAQGASLLHIGDTRMANLDHSVADAATQSTTAATILTEMTESV